MVGGVGSWRGGILTLCELIDEHRGAFEYDWRARFNMPLDDVPVGMSWSEAWRLFNIVAVDPGSQVATAISGWKHPVDRADLVLRDLFDLQFRKVKKNPKAYPRPWDKSETKRMGAGRRMSVADYEAVMARQLDEEASDG